MRARGSKQVITRPNWIERPQAWASFYKTR
jgi:hypothetical protein